MKKIEHTGEVVEISPEIIKVEILNRSACASCHAKGICSASDESLKIIEVRRPLLVEYELGEKVKVSLTAKMGYEALLISYVVPLIILLVLLLTLSPVFSNELYLGIICLSFVAVYFFGIFLFRNKLRNEFIFMIDKL